MRRGPRPLRALDAAVIIAEQRGMVQVSERRHGYVYDFTIVRCNPLAFVLVENRARILATHNEIIDEYRHDLDLLRSITQDPAVSSELWLCSKHGTWRFFRVTAAGILELDRHGRPLSE